FAVSGAEAIEIALKTALKATGRAGVLAFDPAYHGLTAGALAITSRAAFREPFAAHLQPHVRRLPFGCAWNDVAASLAAASADAHPIGAIAVEPIVGREGVLLPPRGWLAKLARLARENGALLVIDEIFTGFGRIGALFACQEEGVQPDLLCCGKALGGGLPIAAVLGRRALFAVWETPGEALHTATFLANPLACAAALAVLDVLAEEALPQRAARLGVEVGGRLAAWPQRFAGIVRAVRGRGLLWGVELASRQAAKDLVAGALHRGVLALAGGPAGRVLQIVPPLSIPETSLDTALALLEAELTAIASRGGGP
ncbi:MAG TPA: aminotransferase class III-fold pyridoxal phosphate-dependent enzyme, partial [Thermoanaerobaculia bacterium]